LFSNPFGEFRRQSELVLRNSLKKLYDGEYKNPPLNIEIPPFTEFGELASTICFEISKKSKIKPTEIASKIAKQIDLSDTTLIDSVNDMRGYLNFHLNYPAFTDLTLNSVRDLKENYGFVKTKIVNKIIVEHSSFNPIHTIHVGQARSPVIGDAIYRTPGAFNQTIQGVKNILKYSQINVSANTVVFQLNYKYLRQIGKYIYDLGIKNWHLTDLIPDGNAKIFYKNLVIKMSDLSNNINNLGDIIKKFNLVVFFDFPLCLFSPQMLNNPRISLITAKGRTEITKQVGYKPDRFEIFADDVYYVDKHKQRIKICQNCKFFKICGGIWKDYLELYGERGLRNIARKHGCLIND